MDIGSFDLDLDGLSAAGKGILGLLALIVLVIFAGAVVPAFGTLLLAVVLGGVVIAGLAGFIVLLARIREGGA
jgi:hypothetical protein